MNEYYDDDAPKMNEEGHPVWSGFDWANPGIDTAEEMRGELAGYQGSDGTWVELIDDTPQIDALFAYVAEPKHRFDIDERDYSAKNMAAMFAARCVEYTGWYEIGHDYLEDHYPGLIQDPLACMHDEDIQQVGANIGGSEHEEERYMWVEAEDGRVFCIVRPAYVEKDGARK